MSVFVWWLSSPSFISQVLLYSTVNVTNASYFVLFERQCGSDGSGSSSTSLENLDEDFSSDEESPKKGKVCWNNTPRYVTWEGVGRGGILLKAFPPGECILLKLTKTFSVFYPCGGSCYVSISTSWWQKHSKSLPLSASPRPIFNW